LPEVSGGVLRYFDPLSVENMADRIQELAECAELRDELAHAGLQRASFFSWEKCARETFGTLLRTHEEITGKSRPALVFPEAKRR
jgi:glycosyltransferase involved in cell wall biosynthesis